MKVQSLIHSSILSIICAVTVGGPMAQGLELIGDPHFARGTDVMHPTTGAVQGAIQWDTSAPDPIWNLAQWNSVSTVYGTTPQTLASGSKKWATAYKAVTMGPDTSTDADIILAMNANAEYGGVYRTANDPWPHLLVQQSFTDAYNNPYCPPLSELSELQLSLDARLIYAQRIEKAGYDPGLHAAQLVLYFTVQNRNPQSPGYGDYLWFGIPLYDDRSAMPTGGVHHDAGTGKLIYSLDYQDVCGTSMQTGSWVYVYRDIYDDVLDALDEAWSLGYLSDSQDLDDYRIGGMNTGWEVPGLNIVTAQLANISLQAYGFDYPAPVEFDTDGDSEGWTSDNLTDVYSGPTGGVWLFQCNENDPKLIGPVTEINSDTNETISVCMANNGNPAAASYMQVFWARSDENYFTEAKSATVPIGNGGGWVTYDIDLSSHAQWTGTITRLRIDPIYYGDGHWIGVDSIRVEE